MSDHSGRSGGYRRQRRSGRGRRNQRRPRQLQPDPDRELAELEAKPMEELRALATELEVDVNGSADLTKDALVNMVLQARSEKDGSMFLEGNLELMDEGYGFLRRELGWLAGPDDVYVSQAQVRRFALRNGDHVSGHVRPARDHDRYHGLVRVMAVNGLAPDKARARPQFERMIPIFPNEQLVLEYSATELTSRIVDIIAPIGRGQRGLVLSPPKAGKTELMKRLARSVLNNYSDVRVIVALIGERPEEVTDWQRSVEGAEVISSTFDEQPRSHTRVAELTSARAKRMVESGEDVMILLDSVTRLVRAYNLVQPSSGRTLSGGIEPQALYPPKGFFGAARNIDGGGSLTIIASCLIETGSRMDEVIYEEFKGTGNWELMLDRRLAERGTFPAVNVLSSGTRRVELMLNADGLKYFWTLRRMLNALDPHDAYDSTELMFDRMKRTATNKEFFASLSESSR
ncbi:MAG: transcription termination factor Rho [Chloroflexi bacterium]|nr:transcription termination factor Rho [Chloroflexota bacterium]